VAEQNLDFNIIAHTQGMEQIANLINRVGALEAETKKLTAANTGLAKSTESVVVNGKRYNNALDAQSKALRNSRMGVSQLGMQFNDLATSISTGASPAQAFNQQIGQIGFALSMMEGRVGTLGRLIAGPLGIAIIGATVLLQQFKGKTDESTDATANFGDYAIATFQSVGASISSGLTPAIEAVQPALIALQPVIASVGLFFTNLGEVGKQVANGLVRTFVIAVNSIAILASNSFGMVAELAIGTINAGIGAINSLISMVEGSLNKMGSYINKIDDAFSTGFRVGEANFQRLSYVTNQWAGTSKKTFADVGAAFRKTLSTDFIVGGDISQRADALAAARNAAEKVKEKKGGSDKGSASDRAKKEKPAFSMLGFYEEYFAKEFEKNEESTAKIAEDQIKSLVSTLPDIAKVSAEMEGILTRNEEINQSFENIGNAVANSFKGMVTGAMSFKDAMKGIISSVIDELFRLFVVQQIVGMVAGAFGSATGTPSRGFGSSTGNYLPGVPFKAFGGSVMGNKPYMVGERGPELFVPGGNGTIIPNSNMRGGGGGSPISISVDARGASDPAAVRAQVQQGILEAAPAIIAAAEARTISSMRRPRLGGAMQ
jgi:hypothetical protein